MFKLNVFLLLIGSYSEYIGRVAIGLITRRALQKLEILPAVFNCAQNDEYI